ncbi:MAG: tyrosine-type recombinase/integrase [Dysgonamonadaceae bacterium]|jgi:integrase/recombinase XerC|nr:tyrosine-type recombinase/integrase [Dysgonamonadaceae bacterium]
MFVESFIKYLECERNYSSHTLEAYINDLSQFKDFVNGGSALDPHDIDAVWVRRWMVSLMDEKYSPLSINRKLSTLKSYFRYLRRNKLLETNPLATVQGPKAGKPLPKFVKDKDMSTLLANDNYGDKFEDERDKAILDTFYCTGIRCAELAGLKNNDVDFSSQTIKVTGKRNKQRIIPFAVPLETTLRSYLHKRNSEIEMQSDAFFVHKNGRQLSNSMIYKIVKSRLATVQNLKQRSPHVLRHTFATSMLNNGANLRAVKELLGHESLASTEIYTHTSFEELKKIYQQAHPRA